MEKLVLSSITKDGITESEILFEESGESSYEITPTEFDKLFDNFFEAQQDELKEEMFVEEKVCFKQTISSVTHPFQTKTEWDWAIVCVKLPWPFKGEKCVKEKVRPRLYRRTVKYVIYAEICYPVDLIVKHVERCAKQGAIAAATVALTGNLNATQVAFQTAFLACMTAADFPNSDKISIKVAGDKVHGKWIPV